VHTSFSISLFIYYDVIHEVHNETYSYAMQMKFLTIVNYVATVEDRFLI
jgi:hypothetical protein